MKILYAILAIMSLVCFILYAVDKAKAKKHKWRIKEATLLLCGIAGGAIGAIIGMTVFRHKTKHWYFWAVNIAGLVLHAAVFVLLRKLGL